MTESQIIPYVKNVGKDFVKLPGNASFYRNPNVALSHAFNNESPDYSPVLFVIAEQNYQSPFGMMFKNEAYTAYPYEREFLLVEGCNLWVIAVDPELKIENSHTGMSRLNGRTITVIHLFH